MSVLLALLFQRSRIQVWLYEQCNLRIEGCIVASIIVFPTFKKL